MSENKNTTQSDNAEVTITRQALPLSANKKIPWMVWCVIAAVIGVVVLNWVFVHYMPTTKTKQQNDNFVVDTTPVRSALKNDQPLKPPVVKDTREQNEKVARLHDLMERLKSPQTGSSDSGQSLQSASSNNAGADNTNALNTNNNALFLTRAANSKAERAFATGFGPLPVVIGQGKFIHGVLETAIDSDLPGQVRAIVTSDVYAEQGSAVLIPRGSRLVGEYKSGLANNQSRLFVVWTRLLEPNGVDVALGSEGTDPIGRAGIAGAVNYHFLARFGAAGLTSLIGAGVSTLGVNSVDQNNSANIYRQQVSAAMAQQANNLLNQDLAIPPTITIPQGQTIAIFVNKDLDFSHLLKRNA